MGIFLHIQVERRKVRTYSVWKTRKI